MPGTLFDTVLTSPRPPRSVPVRRYGFAFFCVIACVLTVFILRARTPGPQPSHRLSHRTSVLVFHPAKPTPSPSPPAPKSIVVAFTGDISISLGVSQVLSGHSQPHFPFGDVAERLRSYDLLVGNLECVITTLGEPMIREPLIAPVETPKLLLDAGFDLVSIANNHTLDMSRAGYLEMLAKLDAAGLAHFGSTTADPQRDPIVIREVQGIRMALIGHFNREEKRAVEDVARARAKADIVIVFEHWGVEYSHVPVLHQRLLGRTLIDAGADAVIGAHAHIVHPIEVYKDRLIAYGLGNFVFSSMVRQGTHTGAVLELEMDRRGILSRRFRAVHIDARGAPHWHGDVMDEPMLDPPGPRPLGPL